MKFLKVFISILLVLFSFNFALVEGQAQNTMVENAELIEDIDNFNIYFNFTEDDLIETDKYGKYFKLVIPKFGYLSLGMYSQKKYIYKENEEKPIYSETSNYWGNFDDYLEAGIYYILNFRTQKYEDSP